ncbi:MAG: hypothetical protein JSS81_19520 [Acidobacteria bacterium]|nr:hypothetical protein [Acidobacteriota bacterium]
MKQIVKMLFGAMILGGLAALAGFGQTATAFEFKNAERNPFGYLLSGELYITVGGREVRVTDQAVEAWIVDGGRSVVYSARDGAGFGDSRGQSLRIYDVAGGQTLKIMAERAEVNGLSEVRLSDGALALLVRLSDGGSGEPYAAVVDPLRGQVYRQRSAEFSEIRGDTAKVVHYGKADWDDLFQARVEKDKANKTAVPMKVKAKIARTETLDLKKMLKLKVITVK